MTDPIYFTAEVRKRISDGLRSKKRKPFSEEWKKIMSLAQKLMGVKPYQV